MSYRVVFQGPIGGLRSGASVTFNGIRVGEVTELSLDPKDPKKSIATISIDTNTPVRTDTEVSLNSQGLTGIAVLALRGGFADAGPLTAKSGDVPLLSAGSSASQDMMAAARDVARRIDAVLVENQQALKNSLKNIETFTDMLARNSDSLSKSVRNIETFTDTLAKNSEKVDRIVASVDSDAGGRQGRRAGSDPRLQDAGGKSRQEARRPDRGRAPHAQHRRPRGAQFRRESLAHHLRWRPAGDDAGAAEAAAGNGRGQSACTPLPSAVTGPVYALRSAGKCLTALRLDHKRAPAMANSHSETKRRL